MATARLLYDNLITAASMISVSSSRAGTVTTSKKDGTGSATITTSGSYSGSEDLEYTVEIDSVAGGAEVGTATFKWSNGGGSWDATGVTTDSTNITLENGVNIKWTSGSGDDFDLGDTWYFKGIKLFGKAKLIDNDRDTRYRSASLESPNTITVDLGSAQEVKALGIHDHNFTNAATILLEADDADTFDSDGGSAQFAESVTWASTKILHYLSTATTKRYWRISVTDAANSDSYISIGEIYLGPYSSLSRNYSEGFSKGFELLQYQNQTPYGVGKRRFYNRQRSFIFNFDSILASDITALETMIDSIASRSTGVLKHFYFDSDPGTSGAWWMVNVSAVPEDHYSKTLYRTSLELTEVMTSV